MNLRRNPNQEFETLLDAARQARLPFERDAWLNLAFYLGEQYTEWQDSLGAIRRIPRPTKNTPRPVVNKIMHFVGQELAMVLQDKPSPDVLPPTDDWVDAVDVAVAKAYCEFVADPLEANHDRQLSRAALWAIIGGSGYLKWCWNNREKKPEIVPCSFFEVFLDPYAQDFSKSRRIFHTKFMDVEQVYDVWGIKVEAAAVEKADLMKTEMMRGMGSAPVVNGVTVNEMWEKPSRRHPEGRYVVWTGRETLVPVTDLPYQHQRLPFTQIGCIERPDSPYCMSPVTYLRPAQMELNKYHAQRILIREKFANPKWWVPADIELEEMPNDHPFQVLRGTAPAMGKPELIHPPSMPDNGDGAMIEEQMMHIVGLHEVSQAQVPGRVEAAKAIEMLKDSDESRQQFMRDTIGTSVAEGFFQILELARQFETAEKMVLTYSREGVAEVEHFRAGDLKPGYRVRTTKTSGLARSRAARQDQLNRMWEIGVITDPEVMAELMEVPIPSLLNHRAADIKLARNENLEMMKGKAIAPNSWDDHEVHLREHNTFRKSAKYQSLPLADKQVYEFHCQAHEKLWDMMLMKQATRAQLQATTGQPPTEPAPPAGE